MSHDLNGYEHIIFEVRGPIGQITLNRPEVRNAFNQGMIDELRQALSVVDRDFDLRVVILTGAGQTFQAGADIGDLSRMTPLELLRWNEGLVRINAALEKLRQPVIAAINGAAMGGGLEMALACTLRVATPSAKLGLPEVKIGIIPGTGGTQRLPRLIGKGRAAKMILTGEVLGGEEALRIGLVDELAAEGEAVQAALQLAERILVNAPIAVEMAKDAMEIGLDLPLEQAVQYAQKNCVTCFTTRDMKEGTAAFLEKRTPAFRGQ